MKFRVAAAALGLAAAGAVAVAAAGSALAQPSAHDSALSSKPPQISGSRLQTGLLPASSFGTGFTLGTTLNTGSSLMANPTMPNVPAMSCGTFEGKIYVSGFGNSAGALNQYANPNAATERPEAIIQGFQDVIQFATASAATTFFTAARTKYTTCQSFSEPNPTDTNPGGGTFQINVLAVSKTTVSGAVAFSVTQQIALSEKPGATEFIDVLYVVAGTDVYSMWQQSGTNDEPSPTLMGSLIKKIQGLYPH
jgi:PknH-like extracellular domain